MAGFDVRQQDRRETRSLCSILTLQAEAAPLDVIGQQAPSAATVCFVAALVRTVESPVKQHSARHWIGLRATMMAKATNGFTLLD